MNATGMTSAAEKTSGATQFFKLVSSISRHARKQQLGLLERPNVPPNVDELRYKVFVTGQPGVGKSHLISWLAGLETIGGHTTTPVLMFNLYSRLKWSSRGIQTTLINCPCKKLLPPEKLYLFQLQMWEVGGKGRKSVSDLITSCPENVDAVLMLFACGDHGTFDSLPAVIQQIKDQSKEPKPCFIGVASGWCLEESSPITIQDIQQFEKMTVVPIIRVPLMKQTETSTSDWSSHREDVLSFICEKLWQRDQVIVEQGFTDFEGTESPIQI